MCKRNCFSSFWYCAFLFPFSSTHRHSRLGSDQIFTFKSGPDKCNDIKGIFMKLLKFFGTREPSDISRFETQQNKHFHLTLCIPSSFFLHTVRTSKHSVDFTEQWNRRSAQLSTSSKGSICLGRFLHAIFVYIIVHAGA